MGLAPPDGRHSPCPAPIRAWRRLLHGTGAWRRRNVARVRGRPGYALPYAGLALGESALALYGYIDSAESHARIRANAYRALELDDTIAESHAAVALYENWFTWDLPASERAFKRAIEIRPSWATPQVYCSLVLVGTGRDDEARAMATRACDTEPLTPLIYTVASVVHSFTAEPVGAMRIAERGLQARSTALAMFSRTPGLGRIAGSPRWHALLRKHGHEETARMFEGRSWPG